MDKGKNRSDLLAAGRQKLMQFRLKKDGKGGSGDHQQGKSSQKAAGKPTKALGTGGVPSSRKTDAVETNNLAEVARASAVDEAPVDSGDLPVAAILARTLVEGPLELVSDSQLQSNEEVGMEEAFGLRGGLPSATLDTHGAMQDVSSSGLNECVDDEVSEVYASEDMVQTKGSDDGVRQLDDLKVAGNCDSNMPAPAIKDSNGCNSLGNEGDQEVNISHDMLQEIETTGGDFSSSPVCLGSGMPRPGSGYEVGDTSHALLESKPDIDSLAGISITLVIKDPITSLHKPQVNEDIAVGKNNTEGRTPNKNQSTGMVMDQCSSMVIANEGSIGKDDPYREEADVPSTHREDTLSARKKGFDSHSGENQDVAKLKCFAITGSDDAVLPALGIMEGPTSEIHKTGSSLLVGSGIGTVACSMVTEDSFVSLSKDVEVILGDKSPSTANTDCLKMPQSVNLSASTSGETEKLKQYLYPTDLANDFLHGQIEEQRVNYLSIKETVMPQKPVQMTAENTASIYQELAYCRSELQSMTSKNEEVELLLESANREIEILNTRIFHLQSEMKAFHQESDTVALEILELKAKVTDAERDMSDMQKHLIMEEKEKKTLQDEKEHLVSENKKLSHDLLEWKERLVVVLDQQVQLETELKEMLIPLEKLNEENLSLSICLDCYRLKLKELDGLHILLPEPDMHQNPSNGSDAKDAQLSVRNCNETVLYDSFESFVICQPGKGQHLHQIGIIDDEDFGPFVISKRYLNEASEIIRKLEKTFHGMCSRSMPSNRMGSTVTASSVPKLILTSETKGQPDDSVMEDSCLVSLEADYSTEFISPIMDQTHYLKKMLEKIDSEVENAFFLFKSQQEQKTLADKVTQKHEDQKLQNINVLAKNHYFVQVLSDFQVVVDTLQAQIENMSRSTGVGVECFIDQVEVLQKEVISCLSSLEKDQASTRDAIFCIIKKLDASTGFLASGGGDLTDLVHSSVDAATKEIEYLKEKLEIAQLNHDKKCSDFKELHGDLVNLQKFNSLALTTLVQVHDCFRELTNVTCDKMEEKNGSIRDYEWLDVTKHAIEALVEQLKKMLNERIQLLGAKEELISELLKKSKAVDELKERCKSLEETNTNTDAEDLKAYLLNTAEGLKDLNIRCSILARKFEGSGAHVSADDYPTDDLLNANCQMIESLNVLLSHIETSVALLFRKLEDADKEISLSKNYLGELELEHLFNVSADMLSMPLHNLLKEVLIPKLVESQQKLFSNSLLFEKGNEIVTLKESLKQMEEALKVKCSEFDLKVAELEQSEQKLSSVREKLSIAVAKGKALVVQRDNLKQSLVDRTNELEKCSQELHAKEIMLHEVETKLKSYSEVDRVEALESELSYIRNSATAFRDSFLLKDSMLQRIEEVLEDLDLPEHFHSKDIVEKIQLLSRLVASNPNSFAATVWDQRSPIIESPSGEALGASDDLKDQEDVSVSTPDELRRRFDDLQRKFYSLAEHNDMLEQSLMERHSIIQRWEELLDVIDMPAYLKSMEPVVRLEWLGKALPEVQREHNSLLAKVENLEESNESLEGNMQELQIKLSELEAALISAENERSSLSILVNKLRHENSGLSDKESENSELLRKMSELETILVSVDNERRALSVQVEKLMLESSNMETENGLQRIQLQKHISDLQKQLAENISNKVMLEKVKGIQLLVDDVLTEKQGVEKTFSDDLVDNLEGSLQKLVDEYRKLCIEKSLIEDSGRLAEENKMAQEKKLKDLLDDRQKDIVSLKLQLDDTSDGLIIVKEELCATAEKYRLLQLDMDEIVSQKNTLAAENELMAGNCHALQMDLVALKAHLEEVSHGVVLQEEKNSLLEEKCTLKLECDEIIKQRDSLLADREATLEKCQSLVSEVMLLTKQRDVLVEQLNQEEQKSASIREKLNVAVRKGKALVQQRDGLKQVVEEINVKVEQAQNQLNQSVTENSFLRNKLAETEVILQQNGQVLNEILTTLHGIEIGDIPSSDPVQMLVGIQKLLNDRLATAVYKDQEAKKSRKAAELLLAELNEVQERADGLQEDLSKATLSLVECCKERDEAKVARDDAVSKLEQVVNAYSEERKKEASNILLLISRIEEFRNSWMNALNFLSDIFSKDFDFINSIESSAVSVLGQVSGAAQSNHIPHGHLSRSIIDKENSLLANSHKHLEGQLVTEGFQIANHSLNCCLEELNNLQEKARGHYSVIKQRTTHVTVLMEAIQREITFLSTSSEPLSIVIDRLNMSNKDKETVISMLQSYLILLFEACKKSILEIESRKSGQKGPDLESERVKVIMNLPIYTKMDESEAEFCVPFTQDHIEMLVETLLTSIRGFGNILEETAEGRQRELKSLISDLQKEVQEKDIQANRVYAKFASQIRDAESLAKKYSMDLEYTQKEMHNLENRLIVMEDEKKLLEQKVHDFNYLGLSPKDLKGKMDSLSESLKAKDQEIEALMQALDEEESQMDNLQAKNQELTKLLEEKTMALESLETSRTKAMTKFSTTVNKFDELHQLSESLLVEVENLQSQLQERDLEVSFLRQEVTRCTQDVLAEQEIHKKRSADIHELLQWIGTMFSKFGVQDVKVQKADAQFDIYKKFLSEKMSYIMAEFNELQANSQGKDALLQIEKGRVHELLQKTEALEKSLNEKESQIELYKRARDSGQLSTADSEPLEIESVRNKGATSTSAVPLIRSSRKIIGDHAAISVDLEQGDSLEDEDDDKVHGFRSLTMSKVVPRFTRPVAERIDGLWVSIERLLMRQPSLRLGLIVYWIVLHAMLAASI